MTAWGEWAQANEQALVDPGAPLYRKKRVTAEGVEDFADTKTGYAIVEAVSHDAATRIFADHPHLTLMAGNSVEVLECPPVLILWPQKQVAAPDRSIGSGPCPHSAIASQTLQECIDRAENHGGEPPPCTEVDGGWEASWPDDGFEGASSGGGFAFVFVIAVLAGIALDGLSETERFRLRRWCCSSASSSLSCPHGLRVPLTRSARL